MIEALLILLAFSNGVTTAFAIYLSKRITKIEKIHVLASEILLADVALTTRSETRNPNKQTGAFVEGRGPQA